MKRFIVHGILFVLTLVLSIYFVFLQADGHTDAFYVKFTTPKQSSLIIGSSRAAQGLQPKILDSIIEDCSIYNYAFSRIHTPYGRPYFESIKKKLNKGSKDGVFIVEVNPWSISKKIGESLDSLSFGEESSFLGKVKQVDIKPNLYYLLNFYDGRNIEIFTKKGTNYHGEDLFVHDDGWYQVKIHDDEARKNRRIKSTIESYKKIREEYSGLSKARLQSLKQTIAYLKSYGTVYVVRLPIHKEMLAIENGFFPDFDNRMLQLSDKMHVDYINGINFNENYDFIDGHHLTIKSGKAFSAFLAHKIKQQKNKVSN